MSTSPQNLSDKFEAMEGDNQHRDDRIGRLEAIAEHNSNLITEIAAENRLRAKETSQQFAEITAENKLRAEETSQQFADIAAENRLREKRIEQDMDEIRQNTTRTNVLMEEIRGMFQVVAEGHGALSARLTEHEARFNLLNTQMNIVRSDITKLESDVSGIKASNT